MKKTIALALLGSAMLAAAPASAATLIYNLSISGGNVDSPTFKLTNSSTFAGAATGPDALSAFISSFKLTFQGSSYVDRLFDFTNPAPQSTPALNANVIYPDGNQDNTGTKGFLVNYTGFNPTDASQFKVDFDRAGGGGADFRDILNGAIIEVGFANGTTQTKTLSGFRDGERNYAFTGGTVGGGAAVPAAVPEPATWAMMLLGFGAVGAGMRSARRRKVAFAFA